MAEPLTDTERADVEYNFRQAVPGAIRILEIVSIGEPPGGYIVVYRAEGDVRVVSVSSNGVIRWERSASHRAPLSWRQQ